jgi:hypothetical protein
LVLVTNETAVLRPMSHDMPGRPRSNGSARWPTRIAYSTTMLTSEKPRTLMMYERAVWWESGLTPTSR